MPKLSEGEWQRVKRAYFTGRESLEALAQRFGVTPRAIVGRATKLGWPTYREIKSQLAMAGSAVDKAALIDRIYRLIHLKLEQMEEDMANDNERTPAGNERDTRAIGTMIRNLEKVHGVEREYSSDDKQSGNGPERRAEAEAIRRELADRLVRLRKKEPGKRD